MQNIQSAVANAVLVLLRPLVRFLLRQGISHAAFSDMAKWVYVDVASKEFGIKGRKQTKSRVAVLTGLTRRQVNTLQGSEAPYQDETPDAFGRAARVLRGWGETDRYCDVGGQPLDLPVDGDSPSFADLVRDFGGDAPTRAILDELVNVGAVKVADGVARRMTPYYLPTSCSPESLDIFAMSVRDLLATLDNNLAGDDRPKRFQRVIYFDRLRPEVLEQVRAVIRENGQRLANQVEHELVQFGDRPTQLPPPGGYTRAGLGMYYFESKA